MNTKTTIFALLIVLFAGTALAASNPALPDPPTDLVVIFADDGEDPNIIFDFCVPNNYPDTVKYSVISDLTVLYGDPNEIIASVEDGFMAILGDPNIVLTIGDPNSCGEGKRNVVVEIKESLFIRELLTKAPYCIELCEVDHLLVMGNACGKLSGFKIKPLNPPGGQHDPTESQNNPKSDPFWIEETIEYDADNSVLEEVAEDLGCAPIQPTIVTKGNKGGNGKGKNK